MVESFLSVGDLENMQIVWKIAQKCVMVEVVIINLNETKHRR